MDKAYRTQWQRARRAAFAANDGSCQECGGFGKKLMIHHRTPKERFANARAANDIANLTVVCYKCHASLHETLDAQKSFP